MKQSAPQTLIFKQLMWIVLCGNFFKTINGQRCEAACKRGIDESLQYAATLHAQSTDITDDLIKRVIHLENQNHDFSTQLDTMSGRISNLERYLSSNLTAIHTRINDEINVLWNDFSNNLNSMKQELKSKMQEVRAFINGGAFNQVLQDLYVNVTMRIDGIEFGTIRNLSSDNLMWRRNFRVVNSTFERMKRNNCLC